ncbi:hypothetical protein J6590_047762 [Homalodisca vitripennis]|nr:hypothetical protein J6590_047762 [Homalodisca vitripennis]
MWVVGQGATKASPEAAGLGVSVATNQRQVMFQRLFQAFQTSCTVFLECASRSVFRPPPRRLLAPRCSLLAVYAKQFSHSGRLRSFPSISSRRTSNSII